jgi:FkbM family methyltransferase
MNKIFDENFKLINTDFIENEEQELAKKYLDKDDIVLEIGARYGSVSCIISQKTKKSVCVEPDDRVWEILEYNKKINNCNFNIVKGFISKKKLSLFDKHTYEGYGTSSKLDDNSNIPNYSLDEIKDKYNIKKFNVLILDCEGFMEQFIDENIELLNDLRMIMFEADQPHRCNYNKIRNILLNNNFIPEIQGFQNIYFKK